MTRLEKNSLFRVVSEEESVTISGGESATTTDGNTAIYNRNPLLGSLGVYIIGNPGDDYSDPDEVRNRLIDLGINPSAVGL